MNNDKVKNTGSPGLLVAAAFIGPGTVTVCTLAGSTSQFQLLWVMIISIIATIVLQEISARLGIVSRLSLAGLLRNQVSQPFMRILLLGLVFSAIVVGNAAYEAGNISGAVLGLTVVFPIPMGGLIIGAIAATLLWTGSYKIIEKALMILVGIMSLSFLITAIITLPNIIALIKGMFIPTFSEVDFLLILGLVGTTIVPYNLFLHASLAKNHWEAKDLSIAKKDTLRSVIIGGIVSMSIIISAASVQGSNIQNAGDLALGIEPIYGSWSKYLIGLGLFAAGITSAVTAPLAAAFVAQGCFNWEENTRHIGFRGTWIGILLIGTIFSSIGYKPIEIIKFAQVTNGLLLPIIAGLIVWLSSSQKVLGSYVNKKSTTVIGILIILITLSLSLKSIWAAL
ncbi:MAG: manganese transporter [Rickettsiales bacterium]|nr:manganese transporter [Rickettsiales bacterium]